MRARAAAWLVAACAAGPAAAQTPQPAPAPQSVSVPSLDLRDGQPVPLPGFWFPAATSATAPAMLLLHGCGGPYGEGRRLSRRMRDYAAWLQAEGLHVLVIDSLTPRGETELCTQRNGTRSITQKERRRDALGALQWLAAQPGVDATRLGLLGWSNGGSTVLAALQRDHAERRAAPVQAAFAVAFYPGCEDALRQRWQPSAPLLMLLGGADDWTPPQPCEALAALAGQVGPEAPLLQLQVYPGAYHGFDGTAPVRHRADVPNGVRPGQGVHVGTDPASRAASRERLLAFVRQAARPHKP